MRFDAGEYPVIEIVLADLEDKEEEDGDGSSKREVGYSSEDLVRFKDSWARRQQPNS